MRRLETFAILSEVASSFLNDLQDTVLGFIPAEVLGGYTNEWLASGGHAVSAQSDIALPAGEPVTLDQSVDWRDRVVTGWARFSTTGSRRIGQANDYLLNDLASDPSLVQVWTYTGTGAYNDITVGAGGEVGVGLPPVNGTNVRTSYAGTIYESSTGTKVWLYADPTAGNLVIYNDTGAAMYLIGGFIGRETGAR